MTVAPASSNLRTAGALDFGAACASSHSGLPPPVRYPAMSYMSLTATVRPASGPVAAPATGAATSCGTKADRALDIRLTRIQLRWRAGLREIPVENPGAVPGDHAVTGKNFFERAADMGDPVRYA